MGALWLSYLRTAVRSLMRQRVYAGLNVAGLALGMACCILVLLYVRHEMDYDRSHPHAERLFRVVSDASARHSQVMADLLQAGMPEVEEAAHIRQAFNPLVSHLDVKHYRPVHFATSNVLTFFNLPMVAGDPATALVEPRSMVITPAVAEAYFPDGDALGNTLVWDTQFLYTVTGIVEIPPDTHLDFQILASASTMATAGEFTTWHPVDVWSPAGEGSRTDYTYVRLSSSEPPADFSERAMALIERRFGAEQRLDVEQQRGVPTLQRVSDIHLNSTRPEEMSPGNRPSMVYGLAAIGLLVLAIAGINFVNLSTARSATRAREVGIRKSVGAHRSRLIGQFIGESLLMASAAVLIAVGLAQGALAPFGDLVGRQLSMDFGDPVVLAIPVGVLLVCGLLAGAYPALALSSYSASRVLRRAKHGSAGRLGLRQALVVAQFTAAIALIICTSVVAEQLHWMQTKDLGFDEEQLVVSRTAYGGVRENMGTMLPLLADQPNIASATTMMPLPLEWRRNEWMTQIEGPGDAPIVESAIFIVSTRFLETMKIDLLAGRNFRDEEGADFEKVLLTESAAIALGHDATRDAVGTTFTQHYPDGSTNEWDVIGVVADFHYESLQNAVRPAFLQRANPEINWLVVRLTGDIPAGIEQIKQVWNGIAPHQPVLPEFFDQRFAKYYESEQRLTQALTWLSGFAVVVACLGILALAAFAAEQRTREIGIRKALGASIGRVVGLLSVDFVKLVAVASALACPLAWLALENWLSGYGNRVDVGWLPFVVAGCLVTGAAALAVSAQTLRAAMANPVDALTYE